MNTDVIMCIIALCAIASPVIVSFMNNKHDYAIRKLDMINKVKQNVLSDFAKHALGHWDTITTSFYSALNQLYIYFEVDEKLLKNITEKHHSNINEYQDDVSKFMKSLSKQI